MIGRRHWGKGPKILLHANYFLSSFLLFDSKEIAGSLFTIQFNSVPNGTGLRQWMNGRPPRPRNGTISSSRVERLYCQKTNKEKKSLLES